MAEATQEFVDVSASSTKRDEAEEFSPIAVHHTKTVDKVWDAGANEVRLPSPMPVATARASYGWLDGSKIEGGKIRKQDAKFLHHEVATGGVPGAANLTACSAVIANLNGGRTPPNIPDSDRRGVHTHVAAHLKDGKKEVPPLKNAAEVEEEEAARKSSTDPETFASVASVLPSTLDQKDRTVDVCWYTGASVSRVDRSTGDPYMLRLDPMGARMQRLNAGAPVFDSHMTGMDFPSMLSNRLGMKAQVGTILKAWVENGKCLATLKFSGADEESSSVWEKISDGIAKNLSFGAWIYSRVEEEPTSENGEEMKTFAATDWEPFEISVVSVPADFQTEFLQAQGRATADTILNPDPVSSLPLSLTGSLTTTGVAAGITFSTPDVDVDVDVTASSSDVPSQPKRPTGPKDSKMAETPNPATAGAEARVTDTPLAAQPDEKALQEARKAAVSAERFRVSEINKLGKIQGLDEKFIAGLIDNGTSLDEARASILTKLAEDADKTPTVPMVTVTRDQTDTRRVAMEAAILNRIDGVKYPLKNDLGRDYRPMRLSGIAAECLSACGVRTRGMYEAEVVRVALQGAHFGASDYFVGAQGTSDFPNILANVAGKTARAAYEEAKPTYRAFSRRKPVTDFKVQTSVQLSESPDLDKVNEHGEYQQVNLSDSKETWQAFSYGKIVNISRQAVVNDELDVLGRIPAMLGSAAARKENSLVWSILTTNAAMADGTAIFHADHANLNIGANSALGVTGLGLARAAMRAQTGPKGAILDVIPTVIAVPLELEQTCLQLLSPAYFPVTSASIVLEWVRTLTPVVEASLTNSAYWYLFADPGKFEIVAYGYPEGFEGVFIETKQGFEVDGVQTKVRLDFGAGLLDHRGVQRNNGS